MSLGKYVSSCRDQIAELKDSLSTDELKALALDYGALVSSKEWHIWLDEHEDDLTAFVSAAPGARRAKRAWQDPVFRNRLTLAAIFHVMQAKIILDTVHQMNIAPGGSYRDMAVCAGEAYNRIVFEDELPLWPFDDFLELVVRA